MRRFQELSPAELSPFRDFVTAQKYYLLLGSGVSLDSAGGEASMGSTGQLRQKLIDVNSLPATTSLQQAYSLLNCDQIDKFLTTQYICKTVGDTIQRVAEHPWTRVYTLNIDNCYEVAFNQLCNKKRWNLGCLEIINYDDNFSDVAPEMRGSIVHLHGAVQFPDRGYVFSHAEYAKLMARPNSWMLTLCQLIRTEPFIIIGTSLEEVDVTYYLEQRAERDARGDVPVSILVEPYPNKLTERLCQNHEFCLYEGTALDFLNQISELSNNVTDFWVDHEADGLEALELDRASRARFASAFELVPSDPLPQTHVAQFLLGLDANWATMHNKVDIPRVAFADLRNKVSNALSDPAVRVLLFQGEPGTGKSSLLRRLAYEFRQVRPIVFWFLTSSAIGDDLCSGILDDIKGDVFIFVDNWADNAPFFLRVISQLQKRNIIIIGTERSYRAPYIEAAMSDEDYIDGDAQLGLHKDEVLALIGKQQKEGFSVLRPMTMGTKDKFATEMVGQPIAVASCRIQNNFKPFDAIVQDVLRDSTRDEQIMYTTAAVARFCYSSGVRISVLSAAVPQVAPRSLLRTDAALPLKYVDKQKQFLSPRAPVVADRVISIMADKNRSLLKQIFIDLASSVAPRVNRAQIKARSPEARLAGRLIDYDNIVKRFLNEDAEDFYEKIKMHWSWNSRYWEQLALLKLDRYQSSQTDRALLDEAVQHARHAYSIESHPLALTTLAKILFTCVGKPGVNTREIFDEAWDLISLSISIEVNWDGMRPIAFIVCFNGVLNYVNEGGILTGEQSDRLRDIFSISRIKNIKGQRFHDLRERVRVAAL